MKLSYKKKCRYHKCSSLREFNRISRKYGRYFFRRYDWLVYQVIGEDMLNDMYLYKYADKLCAEGYPNLKLIINEAKAHLNETYYNEHTAITYTLVGIEITDFDYYWLFRTETGELKRLTCVCAIEDVAELSV